MDWDGKTRAKEFFDARNLVPLIALYVANMVNDVKMNPVHCVGHSLGAHICHMAAAKLKELSGKPMQRLTCKLVRNCTVPENCNHCIYFCLFSV